LTKVLNCLGLIKNNSLHSYSKSSGDEESTNGVYGGNESKDQ
jgi:hypothetical protein